MSHNYFKLGVSKRKISYINRVIFGINPERFKDILQDISLQFDKYIRTTFVADLDNVKLFPEFTSLDILDLIEK